MRRSPAPRHVDTVSYGRCTFVRGSPSRSGVSCPSVNFHSCDTMAEAGCNTVNVATELRAA